jgi:hypothetical protein
MARDSSPEEFLTELEELYAIPHPTFPIDTYKFRHISFWMVARVSTIPS